jgi:putative flippase GtrA
MREAVGFATFLLTGGTAATVNVVARWLLNFVMPYELAVVLAYLIGMMTAFLLMRVFVFQATGGRVRGQLVRFALVNLVAGAQVLVVSVVLARLLFPALGSQHQAETLAHVLGVLSPVAMSYILHKRFSFRIAVNRPPLDSGRSGSPAKTTSDSIFPGDRIVRPADAGQAAGGAVHPRNDLPDDSLCGLGRAGASRNA